LGAGRAIEPNPVVTEPGEAPTIHPAIVAVAPNDGIGLTSAISIVLCVKPTSLSRRSAT
jgi:hypothetical protein